MRKVLFRIVYTIVVMVAIGFFVQNSISDKIDKKIEEKIVAKITELRANGFNVTYKKKLFSTKIVVEGQIEIIDYPKVLKHIIKSKALEDNEAIYLQRKFFEGMIFDYDLSFDFLSSKLDLNIYLSKLSDENMKAIPSFIIDRIEDKNLHMNIDENYNFTFDSVTFRDFESHMSYSFIGVSGKFGEDYNLKIQDMTISDLGGLTPYKSITFEEINIYKDSFELGHLHGYDRTNKKIFKLLGIKSVLSKEIKDDLLYTSIKTTFDSVSFIDKDISDYNFNLYKPSSLEYIVNKIPIRKYEELIQITSEEDLIDKLAKFLEEASKSALELKININLQSLNVRDKYFIDEINIKQDIVFSEKFNMEFRSIDDIVKTFSTELKIDSRSYDYINRIKDPKYDEEYNLFVDTEDKEYKIIKIEVNKEGIFINGKFLPVSLSLQSFFPNMKVLQNEDSLHNENK